MPNKVLLNQQLRIAGLPILAAAAVLNAGASRAILYIDLIEVTPTRTLIRANGSLNLTGVANSDATVRFTALGTNSATGINVNSDVLRFSGTNTSFVDVAGKNYALTGPADPFTATISAIPSPNPADCTIQGNCFATPASDIDITRRIFINLDSSNTIQNVTPLSVWLPNSYVNNSPIANSFFINRGLSEIGLTTPTVTYTLSGGISDTIVFREVPVPAPLPILGAATAFSFSRRLRTRIRKASRHKQAQPA